MRKKWNPLLVLIGLAAILSLNNPVAGAQAPGDGQVATVNVSSSEITWKLKVSNDGTLLTISGPEGFYFQEEFAAGNNPSLAVSGKPDGSYSYELITIPVIEAEVRQALESVTEENRYAVEKQLREAGKLPEALTQTGAFFISGGAVINSDADEVNPNKDQVTVDDLIVQGSACVGFDCVNGENFGFDTLRLKENNLRIKFQDTSTSASFPTNDWQLTANDSANGGANKFSIDDIDGGRTPFTIEAGAPSHSLYVDDGGRVGLGTSTPVVQTHMVDGNTPTMRLEQDGSSGFTAQTWDVAGNEANFFIRDATNGSTLPFRIQPGAPSNSIYIGDDGNVGLGTASPDRPLHVIGPDGAVGSVGLGGKDLLVFENDGNGNIALVTNASSLSGLKWFRTGGSGFLGAILYNHSGTHLRFYVEGDHVGTLDASGNLFLDGTVTAPSDAKLKENIVPVDGEEVLTRLAEIPISTWNFKDDPDIRHMGPMAQDFYAAFELGHDERHISSVDPDGVALAAIQALHQMVREKDDQITQLQKQNAELETRLEALEQLVETLIQE